MNSSGAIVTRNTKLIQLAKELLDELEADDAYTAGNVEDYRREIYVSKDRRAKRDTIKIENSIGSLQIWQATAGELDRHLKRLVSLGLRRKAKQHKIILRAMMQIAVRHGVLDANPIDGVGAFTRRRVPAGGKVQDHAALPAFRAQVRAWARGEAIPGTPAYKSGPPRDWTVVWVVDVITGTGMRPHEVFALLLDDIDLDASDPYLDVTGTLVEEKGAGAGGWVRTPAPKSENGWRRILLPDHTVEAIRDQRPRGHRSPQPDGLVVPGTQRIAAQPEQLRPHLARRPRRGLRLGHPANLPQGRGDRGRSRLR
ncbi:hypothetical protein IU470_27335 [Nocardia abscessus]|uniref:Uncharacterized protein n=1 Tax=Nocardia abscessus TaxID=120957 RepID=A0ABS0CEN0_9NOCA|nr:hypothetical protein [Nocardia abscessus]MBF6228802.1 hypothetical protein [Nocardia abscessus]